MSSNKRELEETQLIKGQGTVEHMTEHENPNMIFLLDFLESKGKRKIYFVAKVISISPSFFKTKQVRAQKIRMVSGQKGAFQA